MTERTVQELLPIARAANIAARDAIEAADRANVAYEIALLREIIDPRIAGVVLTRNDEDRSRYNFEPVDADMKIITFGSEGLDLDDLLFNSSDDDALDRKIEQYLEVSDSGTNQIVLWSGNESSLPSIDDDPNMTETYLGVDSFTVMAADL